MWTFLCDARAVLTRACRYDQAQAKLDKLEGKAGSYEHISGVVKDQNESLAKELSCLHRQVSARMLRLWDCRRVVTLASALCRRGV